MSTIRRFHVNSANHDIDNRIITLDEDKFKKLEDAGELKDDYFYAIVDKDEPDV